jgi:hypothetical protein
MSRPYPPAPLELAKAFGVHQREIAARLDCTVGWMRWLARDPRHGRRVLLAALEAILARERELHTLESMLNGPT